MAKASAAEWTERVRSWRASGLTSKEFCKGRDFTAQSLLWWSSQLRNNRVGGVAARTPRVALARVVSTTPMTPSKTGVRIEIGGARVEVAPGTDRATLSMVLETLCVAANGGTR